MDRKTGCRVDFELFVATLGASSYTYAEATRSQTVPDWILAHEHALAYFGGVAEVWVPDCLKSGVIGFSRNDRSTSPESALDLVPPIAWGEREPYPS